MYEVQPHLHLFYLFTFNNNFFLILQDTEQIYPSSQVKFSSHHFYGWARILRLNTYIFC